MHRGSRHRLAGAVRRHRLVTSLVALVLLAVIAADVRLFMVPASDQPARTDVIVVLGGKTYQDRITAGDALAARYPGAVLLVSTPASHVCPPQPADVTRQLCFVPDPSTTQGEARATARMARTFGWRSITVVTTADQVWRARLRFGRCWAGPLRIVQAPTSIATRLLTVPYEMAATVKAETWQRGC